MKKILNLVEFFFILMITIVLSLLSNSTSLGEQTTINSFDSIKSVSKESVFLISNNISQGDLFSRNSQNNNSTSGFLPLFIKFDIANDNLYENFISFFSDYICDLSKNFNNSYLIRAP